MRNNSPIYGTSPESTAFDSEMERLVLEKVRFELKGFISPALLREIQIRPAYFAENIGKDLAYRIEGVVYGRETRERVIDRRTEKSKETKEEPEIVTVESVDFMPERWGDHLWHTLLWWAKGKKDGIPYTLDDADEAVYSIPNRIRLWYWDRVVRRLSRKSIKYRRFPMQTAITKYVTITPITKHIEIHKHWHTCPHLDVTSQRAHLEFLMDYARVD